jgi:uncharacterized membrane protein
MKITFSLFFIIGGIAHFTNTSFYQPMMPPYLPYHLELIYLSGIIEILLGIGLLIPRFSRMSAFGIILLLIAVTPANIYMYQNPEIFPDISKTALLLRLPLQLLLIYWAYSYTKRKNCNIDNA